MPRMIFLNLPVADVAGATRFYESIGCVKDPRFSADHASSMKWSETIVFMILDRAYFAGFTPHPVADAKSVTETLVCLSMESRAEVDTIVEKAAAAGGTADVRPAQDAGFMYGRSFTDLDGHIFEPMFMDEAAMVDALSSTHRDTQNA